MSDAQIVRPRLAFESEFGQHRNWWVRDARIAGNPLSMLLFLLSHDPVRMPTQTEAMRALGLGKGAWQAGKKKLLEAGFLVEIRDRYPRDFVDATGQPRGGQRRFRLILQDPEPGYVAPEQEAMIELNEPYEEYCAASEGNQYGKSAVVAETPDQNQCGILAVAEIPSTDNRHTENNRQSFKEEKTGWLVGSHYSSHQPTHQTVSAREAELDAELAALHPDLRLTVGEIRREVAGRLDLSGIDVVQAVRDVVLSTAERGSAVRNPAAMTAAVLVRFPTKWALGARSAEGFAIAQDSEWDQVPAGCSVGNHWWGAESWAEIDRANCVNCGLARRTVDPAFAELEAEMLAVGGER